MHVHTYIQGLIPKCLFPDADKSGGDELCPNIESNYVCEVIDLMPSPINLLDAIDRSSKDIISELTCRVVQAFGMSKDIVSSFDMDTHGEVESISESLLRHARLAGSGTSVTSRWR